ncbi:MAG: O-succinylhomoserine sulfhydrylase [Gammaproteobacteria bacterium]|nr:O-succinylhomoserine sulfhydrylase [Gammaproteobacteria bacterium]
MQKHDQKYHSQTVAIRHGYRRTDEQEHGEPIFPTSSYVFDSAQQAVDRFSGEEAGNIYSRFTNPTVAGFENRLAALEGGRYCIGTASGMAAITGLVLAVLNAGDHVIASAGLFGSTVNLFTKYYARFGVDTSFVDLTGIEQWKRAVRPNTRLIFLESPSNPLCEIGDLPAIGEIARENGIRFVVDNAFCTPVLQQPLKLGADIVVHSATKYLDGQGRCVGGALVTNDEKTHDALFGMLRTTGPCMSPFNAWTFSKGLETLPLRMEQHCANALEVARWLEAHPAVKRVHYPGLASHPQHELAKKQYRGFGGIVSFEVRGSRSEAWKVIDHTEFLSITANLGDVKTTITHPATTTHLRITQPERDRAGITDSLVRVSVGLEHVEDIIGDLERGLDRIRK